jgi:hypothetical protein
MMPIRHLQYIIIIPWNDVVWTDNKFFLAAARPSEISYARPSACKQVVRPYAFLVAAAAAAAAAASALNRASVARWSSRSKHPVRHFFGVGWTEQFSMAFKWGTTGGPRHWYYYVLALLCVGWWNAIDYISLVDHVVTARPRIRSENQLYPSNVALINLTDFR